MKLTNAQLKLLAQQYKTFSDLLENRQLYYKLHTRGILKEATSHLVRKIPRNQYSKTVVDLNKLIYPIKNFSSYTEWHNECQSHYIVLRRHGVDTAELFDNINDQTYVNNLLKQFGADQLANFVEKK